MKECIDIAYAAFCKIIEEKRSYQTTIETEQDTRLKVLNRIITEVLSWRYEDISTEPATIDGYVDYVMSFDGLSKLILEAKKESHSFDLATRTTGSSYLLNGPVFANKYSKEGIEQAIRYCGQKNSELACVTNGEEWIIFRGSRLGDGRDTMSGKAIIFSSLEGIKNNFQLFFDLLDSHSVKKYVFRAIFQEAEGRVIRHDSFKKILVPPEMNQIKERHKLAVDIDRIMNQYFKQLTGDGELDMLEKCFVITKESELAEKKIARISESLIAYVQRLDTDKSEELNKLIQRVHDTHKNAFILIVGTKGAGKSTFISRYFKFVLPITLANDCSVIRVNVGDNSGDENSLVPWLNKCFLKEIEKTLYGDSFPDYKEIQGIFFDEYTRWRQGPYKYLYETEKNSFKTEFGKYIENKRNNTPEEYIHALLRHIVNSRKKLPCIIFDNADHFGIEFQEKVFQYARSFYEKNLCLVIVPITDKTSWQIARQGALQSFDSETLFLPTPKQKAILETRIKYIKSKTEEVKEKGTGYSFSPSISLSIDNLRVFVCILEEIFINNRFISNWISNLSNDDIRKSLEITREVMASPYIGVDELIKVFVTGEGFTIPDWTIKKALIRGQYFSYPIDKHKYVKNIFCLNGEVECSPLLGMRILQLLRDAAHKGERQSFINVKQVVQYFEGMGVEQHVTLLWLDAILKNELCFSYDPTISNIELANRIEISPRGFQHLLWSGWDFDYLEAMLVTTPITCSEAYDRMNMFSNRNERLIFFLKYLLDQDSIFCSIQTLPAYEGQSKILSKINGLIRKLESGVKG